MQPVTVEPFQELDSTRRYRGGDMVCGFIVCTPHEAVGDELARGGCKLQ